MVRFLAQVSCIWTGSLRLPLALLLAPLLLASPAPAQERPYFVAYPHHMEEPGALEISFQPVIGLPKTSPGFVGVAHEFEFGLKGWWTTALYLDWQSTRRDSTVFTGFRFENRFRPLLREHWINPVIYIEFADVNEADRTYREVVGFDSQADTAEPNDETKHEWERELELKLILSSQVRGWNISENFIAEKNLGGGAWEFGYAFGFSRPLRLEATPAECVFCRENIVAGIEMYGGLGDASTFTLANTAHYLGPVVAWELPRGLTVKMSPSFGLTRESHRLLLRFGVSYEVGKFGQKVRHLFH